MLAKRTSITAGIFRSVLSLYVFSAMAMARVAHVEGLQLKLLRLANTREELMLQKIRASPNTNNSNNVSAIPMDLELGQGVHSVQVFFGDQRRLLIVDTGSADTAFPCKGCTQCGKLHENPFYTMGPQSRTISCQENKDRGFSKCKSCSDDVCTFSEKYVEGSGWIARKVEDVVYFHDRPDLHAKVVFGCIGHESGAFLEQAADGIMGMSRDPDSIFLQFYDRGVTHRRGFSQCISATGGQMVIGGINLAVNEPGTDMVFTPLRTQTGYTYWTVQLETVDIGGHLLDVNPSVFNANRGAVFDSGTTFLYMPSQVQSPFQAQWRVAVGADSPLAEYKEGQEYELSRSELEALPTICFTFANDAKMCIPPSQYMVHNVASSYTSTIFFQDFPHATIIGASMLANHNVFYDMDNHRIGFVRANCDFGGNGQVFEKLNSSALELVTALGGDTFTPEFSWREELLQLPCLVGFVTGICVLLILKEGSQWLKSKQDGSDNLSSSRTSEGADEDLESHYNRLDS
jgi:hypothetical protein